MQTSYSIEQDKVLQVSEPPVISVDELPLVPIDGATYIFHRMSHADVTSGNHGLHKYPAKFIPQIPRWGLSYGNPPQRMQVLDPFGGSGTTCLEAALSGHRSISSDVSPLATLISRAKTARITNSVLPEPIVAAVLEAAHAALPSIQRRLQNETDWGLHRTWTNWFDLDETAKLLALRHGIEETAPDPEIQTVLLAAFSSGAKASSFLDENQIKVRKIPDKVIIDPFEKFPLLAIRALSRQIQVSKAMEEVGGSASCITASADKLPVQSASIDRVITSPPYVNAIDYTMTHKYNMFLLGLIQPDDFMTHCRKYIGMTERAVRSRDLLEAPRPIQDDVDEYVQLLWRRNDSLGRNRSFVLAQYLSGMKDAFSEMRRVLKSGSEAIVIVGTENRICGQVIPTGGLIESLAAEVGLVRKVSFLHMLANRSSMRLTRSNTGGDMKTETVLVLQKA